MDQINHLNARSAAVNEATRHADQQRIKYWRDQLESIARRGGVG